MELGPDPTNGAADTLAMGRPWRATATIAGDSDIILHRWNCDAVEAKSKAAKGSAAKKTDDLESYVYRNDKGEICLPGEYVRQAIIGASKFRQDPRSPRKTACDLTKAAVQVLTPLASFGVKNWHYEHKCRVQVQRNGVTRVRPAIKEGWQTTFVFQVCLPEYVSESMLHGLLVDAGRLVGVGDFRPTYGRFRVVNFGILVD